MTHSFQNIFGKCFSVPLLIITLPSCLFLQITIIHFTREDCWNNTANIKESKKLFFNNNSRSFIKLNRCVYARILVCFILEYPPLRKIWVKNSRLVPILNFLAFFSEEGLTIDYCSWGDTLSKSQKTHSQHFNNKLWSHYDVIILENSLIAWKNWINTAIVTNSKFRYQKVMWDFVY